MSKTKIKTEVKNLLWFKAHGRCEFEGCNYPLYKNGLTSDKINLSEYAHIVADSPNGPRGSELSAALANDEKNLILLCPKCHKTIDTLPEKYTVEILSEMKRKHEDRIDKLTDIAEQKQSLVVMCGAKIHTDTIAFNYNDVVRSMFPENYPTNQSSLSIELNFSHIDKDEGYWELEKKNLEKKIVREVLPLYNDNSRSISLFALAPQPLLVYLGTLLNDKYNVKVFQKHREPNTWSWQEQDDDNQLILHKPADASKKPMLVIALSAKAIIKRVEENNADASIWVLTCAEPHNDMLKSEEQLKNFRQEVRMLMDEINTVSNSQPLHIYMAMPVACAVELGRVRMPKADKKWILYDKIQGKEKDIECITIGE